MGINEPVPALEVNSSVIVALASAGEI